jgi:hypothetical protein
MKKYTKLIVALAVPLLALGARQLGLDWGDQDIQAAIVALLTAFGVWGAANA